MAITAIGWWIANFDEGGRRAGSRNSIHKPLSNLQVSFMLFRETTFAFSSRMSPSSLRPMSPTQRLPTSTSSWCRRQTSRPPFMSLLDEVGEGFDAKVGEGHDAVVTKAVDRDQAVLLIHFVGDIP